MTLGDLRLGMPLDLNDPEVIDSYGITNIRSFKSERGRTLTQFVFGRGDFDGGDPHIKEAIVENKVVDLLMKTYIWPYKDEDGLQRGFRTMTALFGEKHDEHFRELSAKTQIVTTVQSPSMQVGREASPNNTAQAVQIAIKSAVQSGQRTMARVIFCEENDLNTAYTLELYPHEMKFRLTEAITLRN